MGKRTVLYDEHVDAGARMVDFAGWDMPLHYGSQIEEHKAVRSDAGMFDVSHMCVVDVEGGQAREFLRHLLANDVGPMETGAALYTCMTNERGGILDDLIVYCIHDAWFRIVVNSATREKDVAWMQDHAREYEVNVTARDSLAIVAIQGPTARDKTLTVLDHIARVRVMELKPFQALKMDDLFVSRTGYTGEDGIEMVLPGEHAVFLWRQLREVDVEPCGLGARDTLRLEAGLNLYGQDMDEDVDPLSCGLGWTVAREPESRHFIGRQALEALRDRNDLPQRAGLVFTGRGVLRAHQSVYAPDAEAPIGEITSGSFSPTLGCSIALARLEAGAPEACEVDMRGRRVKVKRVRPPFVRRGKIQVQVESDDD